MTTNQKERIEYTLNVIRKEIDRMDDRMDKAEADGDKERYAKYDKRQDMALERLHGIETTLLILGYRVWQGKQGEPWRVVKHD